MRCEIKLLIKERTSESHTDGGIVGAFNVRYKTPRDLDDTLKRIFPLLLTRGVLYCEQLEFPLDLEGVNFENTKEYAKKNNPRKI